MWNFELTTVNISSASNFVLAPIRQLHHQELAFYGNGMENIFDLVAKPSDLTSDIKVVSIITTLMIMIMIIKYQLCNCLCRSRSFSLFDKKAVAGEDQPFNSFFIMIFFIFTMMMIIMIIEIMIP